MLSTSIGTDLTLDQLSSSTREALSESAEAFSVLGVRDTMTYDFIAAANPSVQSKMEITPDPTFAYEITQTYALRFLQKRTIDPEIPIVGLDVPPHLPGVEKAVIHFKAKGYRFANWRCITRLTDYDLLDMGPFEWASIFSRFSLTLTDRFHSSIFSLKNHTPVITIDHKPTRITASSQSKVSALLDSFGIKDTDYCDATTIDNSEWILVAMENSLDIPDAGQIKSNLARMKDKYNAYLHKLY